MNRIGMKMGITFGVWLRDLIIKREGAVGKNSRVRRQEDTVLHPEGLVLEVGDHLNFFMLVGTIIISYGHSALQKVRGLRN